MAEIYTKLGDDGTTGLLFGGRVSKAEPLMDVIGTLDEAVAALGLARAANADPDLAARILEVQRGLFVAGADLAANARAREHLVAGISLVTAGMVNRIEEMIDARVEEHPLRPVFLVPGANLASAALELSRTVVRRAERRLVACEAEHSVPNSQVLCYLNRVSDLLYVLARWATGEEEEPVSHDAVYGDV